MFKPHRASDDEVAAFHSPDYINFLKLITPEIVKESPQTLKKFGVGETTDCPIFEGLYEFQSSCAGASVDAAAMLNHGQCDIAVNWSGGLHHAKRAEASGFCYVNDIVLGILELLKYHARVMYIDIDIHHGDGVEEAFYVTPRVMTVSFHKFGDYFPGTGDITDIGAGPGKHYAVNVPLDDGVDDDTFHQLFKPIISKCVEVYRPGAIVLQCGADSLSGDRLGRFNLSVRGHAECVKFCKSFGLPLMLLGGGGYTIRNVARCWAYETGVALGCEGDMSNRIPANPYAEYFAPDYNLHLVTSNMQNLNTSPMVQALLTKVLQQISTLEHAPSVAFSQVPADFFDKDKDIDEDLAASAQDGAFAGGGRAAGSEASYGYTGYLPATSRQRSLAQGGSVPLGTNQVRRADHANEYYGDY